MQMKASEVKTTQRGEFFHIEGDLPIETSLHYEKEFIEDTSGYGVYMTSFNGYKESPKGVEKSRDKKYIDPLNRGKYLLSKLRCL